MPPNIAKRLGYGGSAEVDGVQVLVTGGSFNAEYNISWLQMIKTSPSISPANRVLHADGVNLYTGSLNFDVTVDSMALFAAGKLFSRWYTFNVGLHDGNDSYVMNDCKLTSLTLNGAAGGLVNASLSVVAPTAYQAGTVANAFIRDPSDTSGEVVGYWWSGAKSPLKAKSWTLSMTQEATPVYGNFDSKEPLYMKVGITEYMLEVETFNTLLAGDSDVVYICTNTFTLKGSAHEKSFQFNGVSELGTYRYAFSTGVVTAGDGSDSLVIT